MVIRPKSISPTSVAGPRERELSDYEEFRKRHPDVVDHTSHLRTRWAATLSDLSRRGRSSQRDAIRRILRTTHFYPLFAFEALRRSRRLRNATEKTIVDLAAKFNPFAPVAREPVAMRLVGVGRPRLVQNFGPIRRMHQIAVDRILRAIHPLPEQQTLFNGGMPKALRAIEGAYRSGMSHCCEVDFIDFYGSVEFNGLPELLRPLPMSVAEHVVWDADITTPSQRPPVGSMTPTLEMPAGLSLGSATSPVVGEIIIAHLLAAAQLDEVVTYADNLIVFGQSEGEVQARIQRLIESIASADAGVSRLRIRCSNVLPISARIEFASHLGILEGEVFTWRPSERKLEDFMSSASEHITIPQINKAIKQVSSWRRYYSGWADGERQEAEYLAALKVRRFYLDRSPTNCTDAVSAVVDAWAIWGGERRPEEFLSDLENDPEEPGAPSADQAELLRRIYMRIAAITQARLRQRPRPSRSVPAV